MHAGCHRLGAPACALSVWGLQCSTLHRASGTLRSSSMSVNTKTTNASKAYMVITMVHQDVQQACASANRAQEDWQTY